MKTSIIGCDEVGYGALAGPLAVCAVHAPKDWSIPGLNDSKKMTDKQRREVSKRLWDFMWEDRTKNNPPSFYFSIIEMTNKTIDEHGVYPVLKRCFQYAINNVYTPDSLIIIDGNVNFDDVLPDKEYRTVVRADSEYPTVMAASILAKVHRDDIMIKLAEQFPNYDWKNCKGYGSPKHISAIKKYGYTEYHRKSYKIKC